MDAMRIVQLEGKLNAYHIQVSSLHNLIEQIGIALDEDDIDEARRLIAEAQAIELMDLVRGDEPRLWRAEEITDQWERRHD